MGNQLLLVGSIPLDTVEEVMRSFGGPLGRYLPAMPDGEQMNPVLFHLKGVNDSVVTNASSKTIRSLQPMMWKRVELQPDFIDFRFDPCTDSGWQLEKDGVETCVINLSRRPHEPSDSRTRAAFP